MKTAIYIEDGVVQLVLTPANDFEKNAVRAFENKPCEVAVHTGTFYDCRGGWTRQSEIRHRYSGGRDDDDRSLIIRVTPAPVPNPPLEV